MKKPGARQRWLILGPLLIATVAAAWLVEDDGEEAAPPVSARPARRAPGAPPNVQAVVSQDESGAPDSGRDAKEPAPAAGEQSEGGPVDPFRSKSWYVAPPPPPPPRPTAPPLPFKYVGQLVEEGEMRVFVSNQGRQLVIKAGDTVDGTYRVEEIKPGQVVFVYLPLKERQVLATGQV